MLHRTSVDIMQQRKGIFPYGYFRLIKANAYFFHSQVAHFLIYAATALFATEYLLSIFQVCSEYETHNVTISSEYLPNMKHTVLTHHLQ